MVPSIRLFPPLVPIPGCHTHSFIPFHSIHLATVGWREGALSSASVTPLEMNPARFSKDTPPGASRGHS